jgi:hypothetical protein
MNWYLWVKWLHILSSTILFGTGFGIAFFFVRAQRTGNVAIIASVGRDVVLADGFPRRLNVASDRPNDATRMWWLAAATHGRGSVAGCWRTKKKRPPGSVRSVKRNYSAVGLALRAAVANVSGVQREQTSALVGASRLTLRCRSGPPLRAFYDAQRRSQGVSG